MAVNLKLKDNGMGWIRCVPLPPSPNVQIDIEVLTPVPQNVM